MSVLLAIKTFLIAKAPDFFKEVALSFATDGAKGGIKRIFCGKPKDPVLENVKTLNEKVDFLISQTANNNNATIREIAGQLQGLVSNLHIRTAHDVLLKLRNNTPTSDQLTLSLIDYALGCCSRYVNKEACMAEFDRAYREMIGAQRRDPDIIAGKLYCLCLEKKKDEALQMANGLKGLDRIHIWAWIPELVLSDDIESTYNQLPDDIKANATVLANACMIRKDNISLCVDLFKYQVSGPEQLSYENIPVWIYNLSVLTNRYLREWNMDAFAGDTPAGLFCKELFDYSSRFISLSEKTELGELSVDVTLFNCITGYKVTKDAEWLEKLKACKATAQFLPVKQLSYVLYLAKEDKYDEAKAYLEGGKIVEDASIHNIRFYLAVVTADEEYAARSLKRLVGKQTEMPGNMLVFLLMTIKDHNEALKDDAMNVSVAREVDSKVYREVCTSFCKGTPDVNYLLSHKDEAAFELRPFIAIALYDAGMTEDALNLSESCIRDGYIDFCGHIYFDLLKRAKAYKRLDAYLRKVREGGYIGNQLWLKEEYALAAKEEDFPRMLEIAKALYEQDKKNYSYYTCYLTMLYQNGQFDKVRELAASRKNYDFSPQAATEVFNVMLLSDMVEESVEFLYEYIRSHDPDESMALLYHSAGINPKTCAVIRKEYDEVAEGLFVHYKHNDEVLEDIIVPGQRTACMIGKKKGETVVLKDRLGRDETYEIISITSKYNQLLIEIMRDMHDNKYQSTFSFNIDDLTANGGDLFEELAKAAGHDKEWQQAHKIALEEYKKGGQTISTFFNGDEYISELYNLLFGNFKVYNIPSNDFKNLYEKRDVNLDEMEFVLDLSSLILLYEIYLKFGIDYNAILVLPQSVVHLIDGTIAKEEYAMPAAFFEKVFEKLAVINESPDESWFMTRLKGLKTWIEEKINVEMAHEMVEVDMKEISVFQKSRYLTLQYQSAALTMRGNRVFVSEDMAMTAVFGNGLAVSDINMFLLHFHQERYKEISRFLVEAAIYGGDIDLDYVFEEYEKSVKGEASYFANCKDNLSFNIYLYPVVLNFCSRVQLKQIITPVDTLTVGSMLSLMFGKYDQKTAMSRLASAYKQLPMLRQELLTAYKTVYPLL